MTTASEEAFRNMRRIIKNSRTSLSNAAATLIEDGKSEGTLFRLGESSLVTKARWMFDEPFPLNHIRMAPLISEFIPSSSDQLCHLIGQHLPLRSSGRHPSFAAAIQNLDPPRGTYENRECYRLLDFNTRPASDESHATFSMCRYFDMLDVGEALAMEFALSSHGRKVLCHQLPYTPSEGMGSAYPIRDEIGDPTDLRRHPVLAAINTMTIRSTPQGQATFFLHRRGAADVPVAAGQTHVIPCGGFQPSTADPIALKQDYDLWRNIVREYAEEFLGIPEVSSNRGEGTDYSLMSPYRELIEGVREGGIRPWVFGVAFDPLSYYVEVLTAVVFPSDIFDSIFFTIVDRNMEGEILKGPDGKGIEFTEENVKSAMRDDCIAPAGSACLALTWRHRETLLRE